MTAKEITELFKSKSPEEFLKIMKGAGLDSAKMEEDNLALKLASSEYENIKPKSIKAINFCFWFCYIVEEMVTKSIVSVEVKLGARKEGIDGIMDELNFGSKISLLMNSYLCGMKDNSKKSEINGILWTANKLRNKVAHGKFEELTYKGHHLSELLGQLWIIRDYVKALMGPEEVQK